MKRDQHRKGTPLVNKIELYQQGMVASNAGDYAKAFTCFDQAIEGSELVASQKLEIGQFFLNTAQPWRALEIFETVKQNASRDINILKLLAKALRETGKYRESYRIAQKLYKQTEDQSWLFQMIVAVALAKDMRTVFKLLNNKPALYQAIIPYLSSINALDAATDIAKRATELWPNEASTWNYFGVVNSARGHANDAISAYRKALIIAPNDQDISFNLGNTLGSIGQAEEALDHYRNALRLSPKNIQVLRNFAENNQFQGDEPELNILIDLSKQADLENTDRSTVLYTLGKAYDDLRRYPEAMSCYLEGGAIKLQARQYSVDEEIKLLSRIRDLFHDIPSIQVNQKSEKPVFIVGLPRSGTTLIEQILAAHPSVHGAGELSDLRNIVLEKFDGRNSVHTPVFSEFLGKTGLPSSEVTSEISQRYLNQISKHAPNALKIIDKQPLNDCYLGFAALAFPHATFIHCVRDLRDTSVSCLSKNFEANFGFTDTMDTMASYAKAQREHMAFWEQAFPGRIHTVNYEDIVGDMEKHARRIVNIVGLDWSDECLNYKNTNRAIRTASAQQVRQDVYQTSVKRWERYLPKIQPLIDALG